MKPDIIRHSPRLSDACAPFVREGSILTLGNFDGLHLGHRRLLERVSHHKKLQLQAGRNVVSVVVSFYPHPSQVLGGLPGRKPLRTLRHTRRILSNFDVDIFLLVRFTREFSEIKADDFIESFLLKQLNTRTLVIGEDAAVGYKRQGDAAYLKQCLQNHGQTCEIMDFQCDHNEKISSRTIRALLDSGEYARAIGQLGEPIVLESKTVPGQQLGRQLGFPTLNSTAFSQLIPRYGVYTSLTRIHGKVYKGVSSIGVRPSVEASMFVVETHLFESPGDDCYHVPVQTSLLHRLRDEEKFDSLEELTRCIQDDCDKARSLLSTIEETEDAMYQLPI